MTDSLPEGLDGYEAGQYGTLRAHGTDWALCAMHDPSGRRGVWYRLFSGGIEICAGREGDDAYYRIMLNDPAYAAVVDICNWLRAGALEQANELAFEREGERLRKWLNAEKTSTMSDSDFEDAETQERDAFGVYDEDWRDRAAALAAEDPEAARLLSLLLSALASGEEREFLICRALGIARDDLVRAMKELERRGFGQVAKDSLGCRMRLVRRGGEYELDEFFCDTHKRSAWGLSLERCGACGAPA